MSARRRRLSLTYPLPSADAAPDDISYPPGLDGNAMGFQIDFVQIIRSAAVTSPVNARGIWIYSFGSDPI
jgi:hypothetical protein